MAFLHVTARAHSSLDLVAADRDGFFLYCRFSLSTKPMEGLTSYLPTTSSPDNDGASAKKGKGKTDDNVDASSLLLTPVRQEMVLSLPHFSILETLVRPLLR